MDIGPVQSVHRLTGKEDVEKLTTAREIGPRISDLSALTTELRFPDRNQPPFQSCRTAWTDLKQAGQVQNRLDGFKKGWTDLKQAYSSKQTCKSLELDCSLCSKSVLC